MTDYPPSPHKRAQQATLHLTRNPDASASAFFRNQMALQQQLAIAAPLTPPQSTDPNAGQLVRYTPPQPAMYPMPGMISYAPQQPYYSMVSGVSSLVHSSKLIRFTIADHE